jgi:plasmid stabilization system protein ParE
VSRASFTIRDRAARDLSDYAAWLRREAGDEVAERFLASAYESFVNLSDRPGLAPPVQKGSSVRKGRVKAFRAMLILYVERERGGVTIVRVLHAARDWPALLDEA